VATTTASLDLGADLNPAQLEAVRSLEGPHLVVAGAGSGKTRTLVARVAWLVAQGVEPESILLLTFTRRAAREMLRRATALLDERVNRVAGGTFHSFANTVLRRGARRLGYTPDFTILDRADAAELLGGLRTELGYDRRERRFPRKDTLADLYSKLANTRHSLDSLLEEDYPTFVEDREAIAALRQLYQSRKQEQNVMDYDDLLLRLRDLLAEHDDVRRRLSQTYRYIMVDEYQDTNRLQAHIAALLASEHGNLMVVGDDAQSIYSFRGADFRNIMDFPELFPDARITLLEENYRSTQPILDLGNAILDASSEKFSKRLFTRRTGDRKPWFVRTGDDHDQAVFVCDRILELREEGVPLKEIAVLTRAAWHSNTLEIELGRRNIPFRKFGGVKFVEAAHVKDVSALLRIAVNPLDASSWLRVLQLLPGIGPRRAQQLSELVTKAGGDLEKAFATQRRAARYGDALEELCDVLGSLANPAPPVPERLERALGWYRPLLQGKYDDAQRRARDLEALQVLAEQYQSLERFLTDIAIEPPEFGRDPRERDTEDEWITVSTIHSAKGLEWEAVFVLNLNNGQFPVMNALSDPESYEEERRLLYVAVTRCKRHLWLSKPEVIAARFGGIGELSPLLRDIAGLERLVESSSFSAPREPAGAGAGGGATSAGSLAGATAGDAARASRLAHIRDYFKDGDAGS
jgi:DNA helicase-2/ATP-dependent DNA helicase PcrA